MSIISAEHVLMNNKQLALDVRDHSSYLDGHVPGAIHLDLKQWEKLAKTRDGELDRSEVWRPAIGALGIDGHTAVVIHDDGRMTEAARTWFILQWHGVNVQVLDGVGRRCSGQLPSSQRRWVARLRPRHTHLQKGTGQPLGWSPERP